MVCVRWGQPGRGREQMPLLRLTFGPALLLLNRPLQPLPGPILPWVALSQAHGARDTLVLCGGAFPLQTVATFPPRVLGDLSLDTVHSSWARCVFGPSSLFSWLLVSVKTWRTHLLTNTLLWVARQGEFAFTAGARSGQPAPGQEGH